MINKEGEEVFPAGEYEDNVIYGNVRPPPFNPEAAQHFASSLDTNAAAAATNNHMFNDHNQQQQPPPYYDDTVEEAVVWDEHLSTDFSCNHNISTSQLNEEHDNDNDDTTMLPVTPRGANGEYLPSPTTRNHSPIKYWNTTKSKARNAWNTVQKYQETQEISHKTRQGAQMVYTKTKRATMSGVRKIRELEEEHQLVEKSKRGVVNGSTYVSKKCKSSMSRARRQTL